MIYPTDCTLLRLSALAAEPRAVEHSMPHNMCHAWLDRIGQRILQSVRVLLAVVHAADGRRLQPLDLRITTAGAQQRDRTDPIRSDSRSCAKPHCAVAAHQVLSQAAPRPSAAAADRSVGLGCTVSAVAL